MDLVAAEQTGAGEDAALVPVGAVPHAAAAAARALVRQRLRDWDLEHLQDAAVLLTSELVTNVLLHTTGLPTLAVDRIPHGVRVSVADTSPVLPAPRRHSTEATTGRGVHLLEQLADDWGCQRRPGGKAVWFTVTGCDRPEPP